MSKLFIALCALLLSANLYAQKPSVASVEKLMTITNVEQNVLASYANAEKMMRQSISQSMAGRTPSAEEQKKMDRMIVKMLEVMKSELNYPKLKPSFIQLYLDVFDQQEIDQLIEFYTGPAGKALIVKMPQVMEKTMLIMQAQMQTMLPKIAAIAQEETATAEKK